MDDSYNTFLYTIQIGEQLLGLTYSDYQDAYAFASQHFSQMSGNFFDYFEKEASLTSGDYKHDLIRYFYIKAIESRISSDLYGNTSRGNVCDIFWSPVDTFLQKYPTNLPKHLDRIVNTNQQDASKLSIAILQGLQSSRMNRFGIDVLNAVQFLGQTVGRRIGLENTQYKGYSCSDLLTRNELNEFAGINLCKWLEQNGYRVEETNFTRDSYQNVVTAKDSRIIYILLSTEVAPELPGFLPQDLDKLYYCAMEDGATPYYASVSLGSDNNSHFKDGVILYGDQIRYRINAFGELEKA